MAHSDTGTAQPPGKLTLAIIAFVLLAIGLVMLTHGLGLHDAAWLRPNPDTPRWVFGMIGAILVLAALLAANQLQPLPARIVNAAGYTTLGLSWAMAHWLIFFSEGGSCNAGSAGLLLNLPAMACRGTMGAAIIGFDILFVLLAIAALRKRRQ